MYIIWLIAVTGHDRVFLDIFISECSSNSDCPSTHYCSAPLPQYGSNFYDHPGLLTTEGVTFLQKNEMVFDGESILSLPTNFTEEITTDITIFAVVRQAPDNDGYVVGKGVNDLMRDFGLYLRSSKQTVWLAYGSDGVSPGFREILFFYNVTVADGNYHSIAAVIDSSISRAVLYVDGEVVGQRTSLPSIPEFRASVRPSFNNCCSYVLGILYIVYSGKIW